MAAKKYPHGGFMGILVLIVGLLYLLKDLDVWKFWGIEPWTALFVLAGLCIIMHSKYKYFFYF